ncbi:hypothetical protein KM043_002188 [Ampulex compressa]|nr:hypothetical protein KM043_002188 [Ampulex compressa]
MVLAPDAAEVDIPVSGEFEKIVTGNGVGRGGWLILPANIWIVALMASIHRVACTYALAEANERERARAKAGEPPRRTACLHFSAPSGAIQRTAENSGIKMPR